MIEIVVHIIVIMIQENAKAINIDHFVLLQLKVDNSHHIAYPITMNIYTMIVQTYVLPTLIVYPSVVSMVIVMMKQVLIT